MLQNDEQYKITGLTVRTLVVASFRLTRFNNIVLTQLAPKHIIFDHKVLF
jgi:hypothetical protein